MSIICRELWCHSVNAGSWWQSTKLYSTSLAVMSIIGYIIGLGDRHLDNVLVDLATGEVSISLKFEYIIYFDTVQLMFYQFCIAVYCKIFSFIKLSDYVK